jgi:hypothetical protein
MRTDWKYSAALIAAILGVVVPVGLWQWDLRAKSLAVSLLSSVELQTPASISMPDLKLTIAGEAIDSPVLSTVELTNDGAKPIASADFESPLELQFGPSAKVLRARVASTEPPELNPQIEVTTQAKRIRPMLLNPGDKLSLTILTTGPVPVVSPRARIAGVSSVRFKGIRDSSSSGFALISTSLAACGGLVLYFIYGASFVTRSQSRLPRILSLSTMLVLSMLSSIAVRNVFRILDVPREFAVVWPLLGLLAVIGGLAFFAALRWFRRSAIS